LAGGNVAIPACQDILKLIALRIAGMRISNRVRRIHDYLSAIATGCGYPAAGVALRAASANHSQHQGQP
jgi:hypothetical protein